MAEAAFSTPIEVELPDGRVLEVDANDIHTAAHAAKLFLERELSATAATPSQPTALETPRSSRLIEFEGRRIQVPYDATDAEIRQILDGQPSAPVPQPATSAPTAQEDKSGFYPGPGIQGAGRGVANLVGAPFDFVNMAMNAVLAPADYASRKLGGPELPFRFGMVSDRIADTASSLADKLGIRTEDPEKMGLKDRAAYEANNFGTQAAVTAPALVKQALKRGVELATDGSIPRVFDEFLRPYFQSPTKTAAGDVATAAGAGTALAGERELVPENLRNIGDGKVGAALDLLAMGLGGTGVGTGIRVAESPRIGIDAITNSRPAKNIAVDPETSAPVKNRVADKAARVVRGQAIDPESAAETITRVANEYRAAGLPIPTTGIISGDTGLEGLERAQRTKQSVGSLLKDAPANVKARYSFGERDTALRDAAVDEVNSVRPEGANPQALTNHAGAAAQLLTDEAQRRLASVGDLERRITAARRQEGEALTTFQGQGGIASGSIDEMYRGTRDRELAQSRRNYNDPALVNAEVPVAPLRNAIYNLAAQGTQIAPLNPAVQRFVDRFEGVDASSRISMREVNALRAEVEQAIQENLGNSTSLNQLRQIKDAASAYVGRLAEEGNTAAQEAVRNYAERVAPNFRQGAGGKLDQKIKSDRTEYGLRPSETAETFLTRPEDAADLMRVGRLGGQEAETAANARTWLFDQLSRKSVVGSDGTINPDKLTRWRNVNVDLLNEIPGLRAEVDGMVARARRGETLATEAATAREGAEQRMNDVRESIDKGPIGLVLDKDPQKAVASVLGSGNPVENMRGLREQVGKNPEAAAGLKAAVADHLANRVLTADPKSDTGQSVSFAKLSKEFEKNREVMVAAGFTPEEMNALQRAHKALEPLSRRSGQATVGSQTAENAANVWKPFEIMVRTRYGALEGGSIMRKFKLIASSVLGDDTAAVNKLVARAMFDPELASTLLTRDVKEVGSPAWNARLQKALRRFEAGKQVLGGNEEG